MKRFVKLNKEYRELEKIMAAKQTYEQVINLLEEARELLATENDPDLREMAKQEQEEAQNKLPELEETIKLLLIPADPEDGKNAIVEIRGGTVVTKPPFLPETCSGCTPVSAKTKAGGLK
jgi:peptide chain release factor 1